MQNTLAVISVGKIIENFKAVAKRTKAKVMAVVKDDAYGHGAERISLVLEPYADGFAVATLLEGISLRAAGVQKNILVLTPPLSEEDALLSAAHRLKMTLSSWESLSLVLRASKKYAFSPDCHLKINSGMNRYGIAPEEAEQFCKALLIGGIDLTGVFSHLYAPENVSAREEQLQKFTYAAEKVREYFPNAVRHLASTGGILAGERYHFDLVRCGIALYGYLPSGFEGALPVRHAMRVYAPVAQSFFFTGGGVCYRRATKNFDALTTLRLGYGDGFFREGLIGNINPLCMDAGVREGASKFGDMLLVMDDAEAYAKKHGTIVYDALVRIGRRAEKKYV